MSDKRRGLGRGLGALIPSGTTVTGRPGGDRPVDVFFQDRGEGDGTTADTGTQAETEAAEPTTFPVDAATEVAESVGDARDVTSTDLDEPADDGITWLSDAVPTPDVVTTPTPPPAQDSRETPLSPDSRETPEPFAASVRGLDLDAYPTVSVPGEPELVPVPGARFAELPVGSIRPNPRQPRTVFDEEALTELVHSIREIGVLQPIVVRPTDDAEHPFELIMGERRWRATQEAGLAVIPAIIRDTEDDELLRDALLENLHRSDLNALEEAAAYQQLLDDFGCTHEELATRIGRSRPQISNTIRLLRLPPAVQRRVAAGVLSAGHARALLGLDDVEAMDRLAQRIVAEGMSVRATEEAVSLTDSTQASPVRKRPRAGGQHAELDDLARRLGDRLDTRVKIALGASKGRLSIEFASVEDLNRILEVLTPEERGAFKAAAQAAPA